MQLAAANSRSPEGRAHAANVDSSHGGGNRCLYSEKVGKNKGSGGRDVGADGDPQRHA